MLAVAFTTSLLLAGCSKEEKTYTPPNCWQVPCNANQNFLAFNKNGTCYSLCHEEGTIAPSFRQEFQQGRSNLKPDEVELTYGYYITDSQHADMTNIQFHINLPKNLLEDPEGVSPFIDVEDFANIFRKTWQPFDKQNQIGSSWVTLRHASDQDYSTYDDELDLQNSSFEIISAEIFHDKRNVRAVRVKARFTCVWIDPDTGEVLELKDGEFTGNFYETPQ